MTPTEYEPKKLCKTEVQTNMLKSISKKAV
jgi:hypothetical protein